MALGGRVMRDTGSIAGVCALLAGLALATTSPVASAAEIPAGRFQWIAVSPGLFEPDAVPLVRLQPVESCESGAAFQSRLVDNVNRHFQKIGSSDLAVFPGQSLVDHVHFMETTARTRRGFERATVRAFRSYVLEETTLRRLVESYDRGPLIPDRGRGVVFDVGISHGAPKLFLKSRLDSGVLRFSLNARAAVSMEYRNNRMLTRTRVAANVDPRRQRYAVYCLFGF